MAWKYRWADKAEHLIPLLTADGHAIPDELIAPEIGPVEIIAIDAWDDLCGDRHTEMGPIPFTAIDCFASRYEIDDPDDFAFLVRAVRAADRAYLAWVADELKSRPLTPPR